VAATSDSERGSPIGSDLAADELDPEKIWRRTDLLLLTPGKTSVTAVLLRVVGLILAAASVNYSTCVGHVNLFPSSFVRIQNDRGHHVITLGPYSSPVGVLLMLGLGMGRMQCAGR
jgi:hypothetical protein